MTDYKDAPQEKADSQPEANGSNLFKLMQRSIDKKRAKEEAVRAAAQASAETAPAKPESDTPQDVENVKNTAQEGTQATATSNPEAAALEEETSARENIHGTQAASVSAAPAAETEKPNAPPPPPPPVDAKVEVKVSSDRMRAAVALTPPKNGGKHITAKQVEEAVKDQGIKVGINETVFDTIEKLQRYEKDVAVAGGIAAVDGEDGSVIDNFERNQQLRPTVTEDGSVDFKDLSVVTNINKGAIICKIIPPGKATPGMDVYGDPIEGRDGRESIPPQGRNTELAADGTQLVASCDGNLVCVNGRFQVDDVLHINGNIDNEVGNIDFCGKIIVEGDVCEGFSLKSRKSIEIRGNVEGASVIAKEDIVVKKGMNGMNRGILQAGGDIRCKFLENCTIMAGGSVFTESAMNSVIQAEDKLVVDGRRSVLVGGTYTAKNVIEAKVVGSEAHVPTTIVMGISPEKLTKFKQISEELAQLVKELTTLTLDIAYLEDRETRGRPMAGDRMTQLMEKRKLKTKNLFKTGQLNKEFKEIQEGMESSKSCHLSCKQIFPPTQIMIGNVNYTVREMEKSKLFYLDEGEIRMGML